MRESCAVTVVASVPPIRALCWVWSLPFHTPSNRVVHSFDRWGLHSILELVLFHLHDFNHCVLLHARTLMIPELSLT